MKALTFTSCISPAFRLPLNGSIPSQPEPLAVEADQEPEGPQLVSVIFWGSGSLWSCVATKESDNALASIHVSGGCTVNNTATVACAVSEPVEMVKVIVSL